MKKTVTKKTVIKIIAVFAFIFTITNLKAAIIYTDIPDGIPLGFDFNQDGTMEFDIDQGGIGNYITYIGVPWGGTSGPDNNIHAVGGPAPNVPGWDISAFVSAGFTVDGTNNWAGAGDCSIQGATINQDEYLAVRFNLGGTTDIYYGWVRIIMDGAGNPIYKDYAYEDVPNTSIAAGDKGAITSLNDNDLDSHFTLYPNPAQNEVTFEDKSQMGISNVVIMNLLGEKVKEFSMSNTSNNTIDISELNSGVYFVSLFDNRRIKIGFTRMEVQH